MDPARYSDGAPGEDRWTLLGETSPAVLAVTALDLRHAWRVRPDIGRRLTLKGTWRF